jgi:hypothetical protein
MVFIREYKLFMTESHFRNENEKIMCEFTIHIFFVAVRYDMSMLLV